MARPLTKRKKDGTPYVRPRSVERALDCALLLAPDVLIERAYIDDQSRAEYLSSECLVHIIREANRRRDVNLRNQLLTPLLLRCERILRAKIPVSIWPNAAELREEVLGQFGELIAVDCATEDASDLDYYEVRFNDAFRALRIDLLRSEKRYNEGRVELPSRSDREESALDTASMSCLAKALTQTPAPEDAIFHQELCRAVDALPPDERQAVILHFFYDYEIESIDPQKETVATKCGVTGKTIRNRLARALSTLEKVLRRSHD